MTKVLATPVAPGVPGAQAYWADTSDLIAAVGLLLATTGVSTTTAAMGLASVYQASATGITLTVSTTDFAIEGRRFVFKDVSGTASAGIPIVIATEGAQTIDGQPTTQIIAPYGSVELYVSGGNLFSK